MKMVLLIIQLIIQFGPGLFKAAKEIYDAVEQWASSEKATGAAVTPEAKAAKFNTLIAQSPVVATSTRTVSPARINFLRESVVTLKTR